MGPNCRKSLKLLPQTEPCWKPRSVRLTAAPVTEELHMLTWPWGTRSKPSLCGAALWGKWYGWLGWDAGRALGVEGIVTKGNFLFQEFPYVLRTVHFKLCSHLTFIVSTLLHMQSHRQ